MKLQVTNRGKVAETNLTKDKLTRQQCERLIENANIEGSCENRSGL